MSAYASVLNDIAHEPAFGNASTTRHAPWRREPLQVLDLFVDLVMLVQRMARCRKARIVHQHRCVQVPLLCGLVRLDFVP